MPGLSVNMFNYTMKTFLLIEFQVEVTQLFYKVFVSCLLPEEGGEGGKLLHTNLGRNTETKIGI